MRIIGYERVSTARQGASGLGIEAQRQAIDGFVAQRGATLIARFTEVESGRNPDRPELGKALHLAKVTGATLVIAKLDRLSRNAAFLLTLRDSGVRFAAVDLPEANDLTVGHHGAGGAAGARGDLEAHQGGAGGGQEPRGAGSATRTAPRRCRRAGKGGAPLRAAIARNADRHARDLAPVVEDIRGRRRDQPAGDRGGAERPRHAHPPRRALARLDGDEPARPARAAGGGMRQSRLMSLVEAVANVVVGYLSPSRRSSLVFPMFGLTRLARPEPRARAGVHRRVDRSELRCCAACSRRCDENCSRAPHTSALPDQAAATFLRVRLALGSGAGFGAGLRPRPIAFAISCRLRE